MSVKAGLTAEDVLGPPPPPPKKKERERERERGSQNVWGMTSHVRASFSKDWMGNAAKSVTLWASTQNGLLMPWFIVAYAQCTMLADHPDTQSIAQTMHAGCEAKVKVAARGKRPIAWCGGHCTMPDGHCLNILLFWWWSRTALVFWVGTSCFKVSL